MGKIIISGGGSGGIDPDELTASSAQVLVGYTAGVSGSDDPALGTMPNQGAVTKSLACGENYLVPAGYHNGSGTVTAQSLSEQTTATAGAAHLLSGKTAWSNGNRVTGTMPDQGAVTTALNCGGIYTIPAGYHNGAGKITANNLSAQTSATAAAGEILSGKTAWVNGNKLTGTIPSQGGSTTTPGTANQTIVAANRYVTGNVVVAGNANLKPENIKRGVTIFGVTGTWSGYVPTVTDLYSYGNNIKQWKSIGSRIITFNIGEMTFDNINKYTKIQTTVLTDIRGYTRIKIMLRRRQGLATANPIQLSFRISDEAGKSYYAYSDLLYMSVNPGGEISTCAFDFPVNFGANVYCDLSTLNPSNGLEGNPSIIDAIYRIWME